MLLLLVGFFILAQSLSGLSLFYCEQKSNWFMDRPQQEVVYTACGCCESQPTPISDNQWLPACCEELEFELLHLDANLSSFDAPLVIASTYFSILPILTENDDFRLKPDFSAETRRGPPLFLLHEQWLI